MDQASEAPILVDLGQALGFTPSTSIATRVVWMTDGTIELGLVCGDRPALVEARRLVPTPPTTLAEVVTIDGLEGLLVRPELIPGVRQSAGTCVGRAHRLHVACNERWS